jgi:hypothetical protein
VRSGSWWPPLRLEEDFVADFALSPDGRRMAIGAEMHGRIQLVDLRRRRTLGAIELPGTRQPAAGGASGLVCGRGGGASTCWS